MKLKRIFALILLFCCTALVGCVEITNKNCTFINEIANLHEKYIVLVTEVEELSNIKIYKNEDDQEKPEIIGTTKHFLFVKVLIEHQNVKSPKENHSLDKDDFKIKNHTGVKFKNVTFETSFSASTKSSANFSTRDAIEDFSWISKQILPGENLEITLYFEFDKSFDITSTLMLLEFDMFANKNGTDIALINRVVD